MHAIFLAHLTLLYLGFSYHIKKYFQRFHLQQDPQSLEIGGDRESIKSHAPHWYDYDNRYHMLPDIEIYGHDSLSTKIHLQINHKQDSFNYKWNHRHH
jgi:hypothetical protein